MSIETWLYIPNSCLMWMGRPKHWGPGATRQKPTTPGQSSVRITYHQMSSANSSPTMWIELMSLNMKKELVIHTPYSCSYRGSYFTHWNDIKIFPRGKISHMFTLGWTNLKTHRRSEVKTLAWYRFDTHVALSSQVKTYHCNIVTVVTKKTKREPILCQHAFV